MPSSESVTGALAALAHVGVEIDVVLLVAALVLFTSLAIRAPVWHDRSRTGPSPHPRAAR